MRSGRHPSSSAFATFSVRLRPPTVLCWSQPPMFQPQPNWPSCLPFVSCAAFGFPATNVDVADVDDTPAGAASTNGDARVAHLHVSNLLVCRTPSTVFSTASKRAYARDSKGPPGQANSNVLQYDFIAHASNQVIALLVESQERAASSAHAWFSTSIGSQSVATWFPTKPPALASTPSGEPFFGLLCPWRCLMNRIPCGRHLGPGSARRPRRS
jgi:hypothetical protein